MFDIVCSTSWASRDKCCELPGLVRTHPPNKTQWPIDNPHSQTGMLVTNQWSRFGSFFFYFKAEPATKDYSKLLKQIKCWYIQIEFPSIICFHTKSFSILLEQILNVIDYIGLQQGTAEHWKLHSAAKWLTYLSVGFHLAEMGDGRRFLAISIISSHMKCLDIPL